MLALEGDLGLSHGKSVSLIVVGNVLYGAAASLAGWLGDRWSATGMMVLFFVGTGAATIATGLAGGPLTIGLGLAATGLFASIYHPVGVAWLVRDAARTGAALGVNGIFGGLGPAAATLVAGALIDLYGWQAAFVVPDQRFFGRRCPAPVVRRSFVPEPGAGARRRSSTRGRR